MSRYRPAIRRAAAAALVACAGLAGLAAPVRAADGPAANGFGGAPEPLPVTEAFAAGIVSLDRDAVTIGWNIAEGYYLYRDKVEVEPGGALADALTLGPPAFSDAEIVSDEFFGDSAIWRDAATVRFALGDVAPAGADGTLEVRFQGCADLGLCYPPTTVSLEASVPAADPAVDSAAVPAADLATDPVAAPAPPPANALERLLGGGATPFGASEPELLSPEEAFVPLLTRTDTDELELAWDIAPGYYLYEHRFGAEVLGPDGATLAPVTGLVVPGGTDETDEFFGEVTTFHDAAVATVALGPGLAAGRDAVLRAAYQGCAEIGVCYPPATIDLPFVATAPADGPVGAPADGPLQASLAAAPGAGPAPAAPAPASRSASGLVSEQDRLSGLLGGSSLWLSVATFFGLGLLLAFTPCVLPMVPILSSLIVGRAAVDGAGSDAGSGAGGGSAMSTGRAFRLSLVYVLVMATTYALAGILVAVSGANVQVWLQQPWVLGAFAALFVVLALAMFGLFELQVPRALQSRLTEASNRRAGGSYGSVAAMGLLSTLIVGPCVTAPLAGALIYIADTGDALVGGAALFALGLGMGAPLLLIGTSAGSLLPRAGTWMVRVRQGFGVLLLGLAIWMLSRFVPETLTVALAGLLLLGTGVWLGAADRIETSSGGGARTAKAAGLAAAVYGVALLVGALGGGDSLVRPLAVYGGGAAANGEAGRELAFRRVADVAELERAVAASAAEGRPVMLDFYADWCVSCKEMEAHTFDDERVVELLGDVTLVQVDVTENDADDRALLERFELIAPPTIVFFDPTGRELDGARVVGFMDAERFGTHVERVLAASVASRSP